MSQAFSTKGSVFGVERVPVNPKPSETNGKGTSTKKPSKLLRLVTNHGLGFKTGC